MKVYIVFCFDKSNYPSTTEYITIFSSEKKAQKYIELNTKHYNRYQELYYEVKIVN